jgi:hypothetical protein
MKMSDFSVRLGNTTMASCQRLFEIAGGPYGIEIPFIAMRKRFVFGVVFLAAVAGSWVVSTLVTWIAWQAQIEDKAFHCNDLGFGSWLVRIEDHRAAGDVISPGWTWEEVARVRTAYQVVFYAIWFGVTTVFLLVLRRLRRVQLRLDGSPSISARAIPRE